MQANNGSVANLVVVMPEGCNRNREETSAHVPSGVHTREHIEYVKQVLSKFYESPNKENQEAYERLLTSEIAWNLCPMMLDPENAHPNIQFFGASVLFSRIARLSDKISFEHRLSLRSTLISYIGRYAYDENVPTPGHMQSTDPPCNGSASNDNAEQTHPPRHVYIRLCVALIRLAMVMNEDGQWPDPIADLCVVLASHTSLSARVAHQTVCRLLGFFAEEIKSQQKVIVATDDECQTDLLARNSAAYVFQLIEQNLQGNEGELQCLSSWAGLGASLTLFTPKLIDFMFNALRQTKNSDLSDSACDCIVELITSRVACNYSDTIWIEQILPRILSLKPVVVYARSLPVPIENDSIMDHLVRVTRVLAHFVENHVHRVMSINCAVTVRMAVFNFILDCLSFPGQFPNEERISELILSCLYAIADELCVDDEELGANDSFNDDVQWDEDNDGIEPSISLTSFSERKVKETPVVEEAKDSFVKCVREMIIKSSYPLDPKTFTAEEDELFRIYRINICDIINFSMSIIQHECYNVIVEQFHRAIAMNKWPLQESCLNVLGSLIEQEDFGEEYLISWLLETLPTLNFEVDDRFLITGLTFMGQLAESVIGNVNCLTFCMEFCLRHILRLEVTQHATISLRSMCRENREYLAPMTQALVNTCAQIISDNRYEEDDRTRCMSIVGYSLSFIQDNQILLGCFEAVIAPFINRLVSRLDSFDGNSKLPKKEMDEIMLDFSLISNFVIAFTTPYEDNITESSNDFNERLNINCIALMKGLLPILINIIQSKNCTSGMFKHCSEIFSRFVSFLEIRFEPFLPQIAEILISAPSDYFLNTFTLNFVRQSCILFYPSCRSFATTKNGSISLGIANGKQVDGLCRPINVQQSSRCETNGSTQSNQTINRSSNRSVTQQLTMKLFLRTLESSLELLVDTDVAQNKNIFAHDADYLCEFMMFVQQLARYKRNLFDNVSDHLYRLLLDAVIFGLQQNEQFVVKQCADTFVGLMRFDRGRKMLPVCGHQLCQLFLRTMLLRTPIICMEHVLRAFLLLTRKEYALPITQWIRQSLSSDEYFRITSMEKEKIAMILVKEGGTQNRQKCLTTVMHFADIARTSKADNTTPVN